MTEPEDHMYPKKGDGTEPTVGMSIVAILAIIMSSSGCLESLKDKGTIPDYYNYEIRVLYYGNGSFQLIVPLPNDEMILRLPKADYFTTNICSGPEWTDFNNITSSEYGRGWKLFFQSGQNNTHSGYYLLKNIDKTAYDYSFSMEKKGKIGILLQAENFTGVVMIAAISSAIQFRPGWGSGGETTHKYNGVFAGGLPPFNNGDRYTFDPIQSLNGTALVGGWNWCDLKAGEYTQYHPT